MAVAIYVKKFQMMLWMILEKYFWKVRVSALLFVTDWCSGRKVVHPLCKMKYLERLGKTNLPNGAHNYSLRSILKTGYWCLSLMTVWCWDGKLVLALCKMSCEERLGEANVCIYRFKAGEARHVYLQSAFCKRISGRRLASVNLLLLYAE